MQLLAFSGRVTALAALALPAFAQSPTIVSVSPTHAAAPEVVTILGTGFDASATVTIDGVPAAVTAATATQLTVQPAPGAPGFADVVVATGGGSVTAAGAAQLWPTLAVATDGLGGTVSTALELGSLGIFELAVGALSLPGPVPIGGIAHGLELDPAGPILILASGAAPDLQPALAQFPAPIESALLGVPIPLQALVDLAGPPAGPSFTNLATLVFEAPSFGPPTGAAYPQNPVAYSLGSPIAPNVPTVVGVVEEWNLVVLPQFGFWPLPEGLTLDAVTGAISGSPLEVQPPTNHLVVASNAAGSTSTNVNIAVVGAAPNLVGYALDPAVYDYGQAIAPNAPIVDGFVETWSIAPDLPGGLALDPATGVIAGTATEGLVATAFTVTATNDAGSDEATLTLAVTGSLELVSVTVPDGAVWEVNRPIDLEFSAPVDPASVSPQTVAIQSEFGLPALGWFSILPWAPETVRFQPVCPTDGDLASYGLTPGGVGYTVTVFGLESGPTTVQALDGQQPGPTSSVGFETPLGDDPATLFHDPIPGPPSVVVQHSGPVAGASTVLVGGVEVPLQMISGAPQPIFDLPLNLFSDPGGSFTVFLRFDQPVQPTPENVSADRVWLERQVAPGVWERIPSAVELLENCVAPGAVVALAPVGVVPPAAFLRARVGTGFADLVGEQGAEQVGFSDLRTLDPSDPHFDPPGDIADEIFESFNVAGGAPLSLEGPPDPLLPAAVWADGKLMADTGFAGTGGPGGDFDWLIQAGTSELFSTDFDSIVGGPGFVPTAVQSVVGGVVQVDDFRVEQGATLRVVGPNPLVILATGRVEVLGTIDVSGIDAFAVAQLNAPNIPQPGGVGVAGGGDGGFGSPMTTTSSAQGGAGEGPFGAPGLGGVGGEAGFKAGNSDEARRGGGGGGGSLGNAATLAPTEWTTAGFDGAPNATGAVFGQSPPVGGPPGPSAFTDGDPTNDFWGVLVDPGDPADPSDDVVVVGELAAPIAGTGGGGGGDTIKSDVFPPVTFKLSNEKKAGGGGGGGGQLRIEALGDVVFGAAARLAANGGRGGEGESTAGTNQIGGGGGGGSGGHVIVQTAAVLDLSANPVGVIQALGGGGAKGKNDSTTGLGAGGQGGAGVVQVHLPSFDEFDPQTGAGHVILPTPGGDVAAAIDALGEPRPWSLLTTFSRYSRARTVPIALGAGLDNPLSALTQPLFDFAGVVLDPNAPDYAAVETALQLVVDRPPILTGPVVALEALVRVVVVDAAALLTDASLPFSKDVYLRNPALLAGFELELLKGIDDGSFTVASATFGGAGTDLTLILDQSGGSLSAYEGMGTTFALVPRFFRASTDGALDVLLDAQAIEIRFQGLASDANGDPDLVAPLVPWTPDVGALSSPALPSPVEFVQFEVTFDQGAGASAVSPRPALEFLRLVFRF